MFTLPQFKMKLVKQTFQESNTIFEILTMIPFIVSPISTMIMITITIILSIGIFIYAIYLFRQKQLSKIFKQQPTKYIGIYIIYSILCYIVQDLHENYKQNKLEEQAWKACQSKLYYNERKDLSNKETDKLLDISLSDIRAITTKGLRLYDKGDFKNATKYFNQAASKNDPVAQYYLGLNHLFGFGEEKNVNKGISLIKKSANAGYIEAQLSLSNLYITGYGVDVDINKYQYWIECINKLSKIQNGYLRENYEKLQMEQALFYHSIDNHLLSYEITKREVQKSNVNFYGLHAVICNKLNKNKELLDIAQKGHQQSIDICSELLAFIYWVEKKEKPQNLPKAENILLKLSINGNKRAQNLLGKIYKDLEKESHATFWSKFSKTDIK